MCSVVDITLIVQDTHIMCIGYIYAMKDGVDMSWSPCFLFRFHLLQILVWKVGLY